MHLNPYDAVALTRLAASTLDVERKTPRSIPTHPRFRQLREQFPDRRKKPCVSRRIGSRCTPDRALVNVNHLIQMLHAFHALVRSRPLAAAVELLRQRAMKRVEHQRRFART